jgi:integrase
MISLLLLGYAKRYRKIPARIVKRAAEAAGLDPEDYAGHSLRAGFATQAFLNGVTEVAIMRQTRHKSLNTLHKGHPGPVAVPR